MTVEQLTKEMLSYFGKDKEQLNHAIRTHGYAKLLGKTENLSEEKMFIVEAAALTHNIAYALCKERYGYPEERFVEIEGDIQVRMLLKRKGLPQQQIDAIAYVVSHQYSRDKVERIEHQILLEADFIVHATDQMYSRRYLEYALEHFIKTEAGKKIVNIILELKMPVFPGQSK